ncbi:MAG: nucleotidyltransferase domain-containing protein [Nanobdellota archaeon]
MKGWEASIENFLQKWKNKDNVLAAVLTGSYATGLQTKHSDINIHIILDNNTTWRERGYKTVDKHHIAYFATPFQQLIKHLDDDKQLGRNVDATAFAGGQILFDKTGVGEQLQEHAAQELKTPFPELDKQHVELLKAAIHEGFLKLQSSHADKTSGFSFAYNLYLDKILSSYARFLNTDLPHQEKIGAFLTDRSFQSRYGVNTIPDTRFKTLFKEALSTGAKTKQLDAARKLRNYTLKKMGGFDENNWKVRQQLQ